MVSPMNEYKSKLLIIFCLEYDFERGSDVVIQCLRLRFKAILDQ